MQSIEEAIIEIENMVCGRYREIFPKSKLRNNPKENIEFLKFNFETLSKAKNNDVKFNAFENILNIVLDDHDVPDSWKVNNIVNYFDYCRSKKEDHRLIKYPSDCKNCARACDEILIRLEEDEKDNNDTMSVKELNDKYKGKYLYFNGDENGWQHVVVNNIHKDKDGYLCVDGFMINMDAQDNIIQTYGINNEKFGCFYYFDNYTNCGELDKALMSSPIDTECEDHLEEPGDIFMDVCSFLGWIFENDEYCLDKKLSEEFYQYT